MAFNGFTVGRKDSLAWSTDDHGILLSMTYQEAGKQKTYELLIPTHHLPALNPAVANALHGFIKPEHLAEVA